jgi:hypothetical protein
MTAVNHWADLGALRIRVLVVEIVENTHTRILLVGFPHVILNFNEVTPFFPVVQKPE